MFAEPLDITQQEKKTITPPEISGPSKYRFSYSHTPSTKRFSDIHDKVPATFNIRRLLENTTETKTVLEDLYTFVQIAPIEEYLNKNYFLRPLLVELHSVASHFFPAPELELELITDPTNEAKTLLASIVTSLPEEESFQLFNEFRYSWWLDNLDRAGSKLLITVIV